MQLNPNRDPKLSAHCPQRIDDGMIGRTDPFEFFPGLHLSINFYNRKKRWDNDPVRQTVIPRVRKNLRLLSFRRATVAIKCPDTGHHEHIGMDRSSTAINELNRWHLRQQSRPHVQDFSPVRNDIYFHLIPQGRGMDNGAPAGPIRSPGYPILCRDQMTLRIELISHSRHHLPVDLIQLFFRENLRVPPGRLGMGDEIMGNPDVVPSHIEGQARGPQPNTIGKDVQGADRRAPLVKDVVQYPGCCDDDRPPVEVVRDPLLHRLVTEPNALPQALPASISMGRLLKKSHALHGNHTRRLRPQRLPLLPDQDLST